jgi:cytochrome b561
MEDGAYKPTSIGNWLITFILLAIPVANIILCFWWAFNSETPISKSNFAKATLIMVLVLIVLYVFIFGMALSGLINTRWY